MPLRDKNKLFIYTPTYYKSTGLQYRLSMLIKSLKENGYDVHLYVDEHETLVRGLYDRFAKYFLKYEYAWKFIGKYIAKKILNYGPNIVFLITDITASAIPLLKSAGINTVLFLEDLTVDWLQITGKARERILKRLSKYVLQADLVVVPGNHFRKKICKELGINSIVCPPGLELRVTVEEALSRSLEKISILHARQIVHPIEAQLLELITIKNFSNDRYVLYALKAGRYHTKVRSRNVCWYYYPTLENAIKHVKKCHIGLIATPRVAPTFTSYWFHLSLLQPLIAVTNRQVERGYWIPFKEFMKKPSVIEEVVEDIVSRYRYVIENLYEYITVKLNRESTHRELLRRLKEL